MTVGVHAKWGASLSRIYCCPVSRVTVSSAEIEETHWGKALPVMQVWQASEGFQPSRRGFGWEDHSLQHGKATHHSSLVVELRSLIFLCPHLEPNSYVFVPDLVPVLLQDFDNEELRLVG